MTINQMLEGKSPYTYSRCIPQLQRRNVYFRTTRYNERNLAFSNPFKSIAAHLIYSGEKVMCENLSRLYSLLQDYAGEYPLEDENEALARTIQAGLMKTDYITDNSQVLYCGKDLTSSVTQLKYRYYPDTLFYQEK